MVQNLFAYGTLQSRALITRIIGRELDARGATLFGYARYRVAGRPYPGLTEHPAGEVDGMLYAGIDAADVVRLDAYEGDLYERRLVEVWLGDRPSPACTYVLGAEHLHHLTREPWDLARFEREHLQRYLAELGAPDGAPSSR